MQAAVIPVLKEVNTTTPSGRARTLSMQTAMCFTPLCVRTTAFSVVPGYAIPSYAATEGIVIALAQNALRAASRAGV